MLRSCLILASSALLWLAAEKQSLAHWDDDRCDKFEVTFSPAPALRAYDPFGGEETREVTVGVKSRSSGQCDVALTFQRPSLPPVMSRRASTLEYAIEGSGGNSLVQTTDGNGCAPANRIDFFGMRKGDTRSAVVRVRLPAGQVRQAGDYADEHVDLVLAGLNEHREPSRHILRKRFKANTRVIAKCVLPPPTPATHNFSGAITQGVPNPAQIRTSTFSNVQCTAPAKIRLIGNAMQPSAPLAPRSGFDNFINWRAAATFGNANAVLATSTTQQVDSQYNNLSSGPTLNGTINVGINLLRGKPLIAGTYSSTLTVAIDPDF